MDIYSEIILDRYKNPKNKGKIKNPDKKAEEDNPLCGDKIQIYLKLDKKGKISQAKFTGEGCAISQASADMFMETLIGKSLKEIEKIKNEDVIKALKIPITGPRTNCALLCLKATRDLHG